MIMGYVFITIVVAVVCGVWIAVVIALCGRAAADERMVKIEQNVRENLEGLKYLTPEDKEWLDSHYNISSEK